jgi:hypothetical protein
MSKGELHAQVLGSTGRGLPPLALMLSQAFFYNAIFFTYSLVLLGCQ